MLLGLALGWRYRDRPIVAALASGLVIALKLFFWPLLIWFVATRRHRTAALAALVTGLLLVVLWAGISFAGLRGYPHLLSTVSSIEGPRSYSIAALVQALFSSWTAAVAVETVLGGILLLLVLAVGRRGRDRDAFALTIVAVLALTPLLEMHYLAALLSSWRCTGGSSGLRGSCHCSSGAPRQRWPVRRFRSCMCSSWCSPRWRSRSVTGLGAS